MTGDLIDGTYSNGGDEKRLAQEWFERCWFGMFPDKSLFNYIIEEVEVVPENLYERIDTIKTLEAEIEYYRTHSEEYSEKDYAFLCNEFKKHLLRWNEITKEYADKYPNATIEKELEFIMKWYDDTKNLCDA